MKCRPTLNDKDIIASRNKKNPRPDEGRKEIKEFLNRGHGLNIESSSGGLLDVSRVYLFGRGNTNVFLGKSTVKVTLFRPVFMPPYLLLHYIQES